MKIINDELFIKIEKELKELGLLGNSLPSIIEYFLKALHIENKEIPKDIKVAMVSFWLSVYATQFRPKIYYRGIVPLNNISFIFAPSSTGKDLTYNQIKSLFQHSMYLISEQIQKRYEILKAENEKLRLPKQEIGFSTSEGMIDNLSAFEQIGIGEAFIYTGEFMAEYSSNPNCSTIFRDLNEIVGTGIKNMKQLKAQENQTKAITGSGLCALLASDISRTAGNIELLDKLKTFFLEGLARRSNVIVIKQIEKEYIDENEFMQMLLSVQENSEVQDKIKSNIMKRIYEITEKLLSDESNLDRVYTLNKECKELMIKYQAYIDKYVDNLLLKTQNKESIALYVLHKRDNEFRAIRLATAIALFKGSKTLEKEHIIDAIKITEYLNKGMEVFEKDLNKTLPDLFVEYCNNNSLSNQKNEYKASDLLKARFIKSKQAKSNMEELCLFANQIDTSGFYEYNDKSIFHTKLIEQPSFIISYKDLDGVSKENRHTQISKDFFSREYKSFDDLKEILSNDCAYSGFTFKEGIRRNENIINSASILIFDVDDSHLTYRQFHNIIKHLNHHIAKTSDDNNDYKFRVILELDRYYNLDNKYFSKIRQYVIKNYLLNLTVDKLALAQAYYGYKDREVLSVIDKKKVNLKEVLNELSKKKESNLTIEQRKEILNDNQLSMFGYAMNISSGDRNNRLIRAINHLKDLDASYDRAKDIVIQLNETYEPPLTEQELDTTIFPRLNKLFGDKK